MCRVAERVWNTQAKWMGNLIPVGCMSPFAVAGILVMALPHRVSPLGVGLCLGSLVVGWFAVDRFGLFGNDRLRRGIQRNVLSKAGRDASNGVFVGFARPSYVGLLDAHEDLGFLFLGEADLEFLGEAHHVTIPKRDVLGVRFRGNVHSVLGLGRWLGIEAMHKGKRVRLLVEPREERTLLGNRRRGARLRREIEEWVKRG